MRLDGYGIFGVIALIALLLASFSLLGSDEGKDARKVARIGVMLSLAIALSVMESFLPDFLLPGLRLGLANIAVVLVLYVYGIKEGFYLALGKAVLSSLLRGSIFSMGGFMALSGTMLSFLGMALLRVLWKKCSPVLVSVIGALLHVSGQILVAYIYLGVGVLGYLPFLLLASFLTGVFVGLVAYALLRHQTFVAYIRGK